MVKRIKQCHDCGMMGYYDTITKGNDVIHTDDETGENHCKTNETKIFKYPVEIKDNIELIIPKRSKLLKVGMQNGKLTFWYQVDPNNLNNEKKRFRIYGTGQSIECPNLIYIDTVFDRDTVWHIFKENK